MPSHIDALWASEERSNRRIDKTIGTFKVVTTSPFAVQLDGAADAYGTPRAVPGTKVAGASYSIGTVGYYLLVQGQLPFCIPSA